MPDSGVERLFSTEANAGSDYSPRATVQVRAPSRPRSPDTAPSAASSGDARAAGSPAASSLGTAMPGLPHTSDESSGVEGDNMSGGSGRSFFSLPGSGSSESASASDQTFVVEGRRSEDSRDTDLAGQAGVPQDPSEGADSAVRASCPVRLLARLLLCGRDGGGAAAAGARRRGSMIDEVMDSAAWVVIQHLGNAATGASFLPVCRGWFHIAVCHPDSFCSPVQAWTAAACRRLDAQLLLLCEPPDDDMAEDLRLGLEHAEQELRLTEMSASFPSGVTLVLLRYARRLSALLQWLGALPAGENSRPPGLASEGEREGAALRQRYLLREADEFRRRVTVLAQAVDDLRRRLPDSELPLRWALWFELQGEAAGIPADHCKRYRSQREQVSAVWANNRRTFYSTSEHVDALVQNLDELDRTVAGPGGCGDDLVELVKRRRPGACGALLARLCRRLCPPPAARQPWE